MATGWNTRKFNKGALYFGKGEAAPNDILTKFEAGTLDRTSGNYLGVTIDGVALSLQRGIQPYLAEETGITVLGAVDQGVNAIVSATFGESANEIVRDLLSPLRVDANGLFTYNAQETDTGGALETESQPLVFVPDESTTGLAFVIYLAYPNLRRTAQLANKLRNPHVYPVVFQMIGVQSGDILNTNNNSLLYGPESDVQGALT